MLFFLYLSFFIFSFFLFFFFFFFSSRRRHTRSLRDWSSDVCSSDLRAVFNPHRFGPPLGVTPASPCSWVDRPGFGSAPWNFVRPRYRTRFRYGSAGNRLSLAPE